MGPTYNILIDNRHDDETLEYITMKYMLGGNNILLVNTILESSTTGFVERIQKGEHLSHSSQHMEKVKINDMVINYLVSDSYKMNLLNLY